MRRAIRLLAVVAFLVLAAPAVAQAAPPTGLTGQALDARVELAWQPVTGATSYRVFRGATATTVTTPLMADPFVPPFGAPPTYTDTTAVNGTTYYYAVRATVGGVESANGPVIRATPRARTCSGGNPVVAENCRPGDVAWNIAIQSTGVAGYATAESINRGESVDLKVQAGTGATKVDLQVFRSGYYGGAGARLFSTMVDVPVAAQPACANDLSVGLYDCSGWSVTQTVTTTASWPSGVYLVRVRRTDTGDDTHIMFVVRDDARGADVLYGIPDTTYQAYNNFGGKSTYDHNSSGPVTVTGSGRAAKVSFDRPYLQQHDFSANDWYTRADYATVAWMERWGYDVSYSAASDAERSGARLRDHRVVVSGVHDEYYSTAMRASLEQARDAGIDLFFTGANEVFWKVRFEPSAVTGRTDRVMVCYKSTQSGPADPSGTPTGTWRDPAGANRPENALSGVQYVGQQIGTYFPLRVTAAQGKDRIWRYTGLENQATGATASIGTSIVGWEWDARVTNGQEPTGVTTLAASPASGDILQDAGRTYAPGSTVSHVVKRTTSAGALIVSTGTNNWYRGLARNARSEGEPDARIQQATTNVLGDMGALPETPPTGIVLDDPNAPPVVLQRTPSTNATGVDPATVVRATFSRAMDPATITASTFTLSKADGTAVQAGVTYDAQTFTATLTPAFKLDTETGHTARLDPTVKAANGIALGTAATWSFTTAPPDRTAPTVSITAPSNGATVVSSATVTATASDETSVAGVQFRLDGGDLGAEDTTAPYSVAWDARGVSAGSHTLTAVARDSSDNRATSATVTVTVDPTGLVAAYGFEEPGGTSVTDSAGKGNSGTIGGGATRAATGRFGSTIVFDGVDDMVTVPDSASLDLTTAMTLEAWVNPTAVSNWRTVLMKEQPSNLVYGLYANSDTNRPSAHVYTSAETDTRGTAQLAANTWTHLAATFDGATLRLYANGAVVSSKAVSGSLPNDTGSLRIGANSIWGERFAGRIDEVRIYRRVLDAGEIQADMQTAIAPQVVDTQAPSVPGGLSATGGTGSVALSWNAASDNVGVDHYDVHRSTTAGFTPSAANRIAQVPSGTSYTDGGLAAGTYRYRVIAVDAAGNPSGPSAEASATVTGDVTAPTVSLTAPAGGATVSGTVTVTATASDNAGVAGVQFRLDGADLGTEDTASPYSTAWDTSGVANGSHVLTAVARDAAGNRTTSSSVTVSVANAPTDPSGLVAAYGFEETSGTTATDRSSSANTGTLVGGVTRSASGRFGNALSFDGVNDQVSAPDAASLDLTTAMTLEAWVNPTAVTSWRTVLMKEGTRDLSYGMYSNTNTNRPSAHAFVSSEVDTRGTAQLPANAWSHLAATYDGANLRLYVNGTLASTRALTGTLANGTGSLRTGGSSLASEWFAGRIDEVRIYRRALSAAEIAQDSTTPVVPQVADTQAPTAPGGFTATGGLGEARLAWSAATDDVGVVRYNVHRSTTTGFTPTAANRIAQVTGTSYADQGLTAGDRYYVVTAEDAAGNIGPPSAERKATITADTTPPTVSITAPAAGATVSGSVSVTASASDEGSVAGVQFKLDGADLGAEDTTAPYTTSWTSTSASNGSHALTAVARDGAGNTATSPTVTVNVSNQAPDPTGLVAAYGFEEGSGTSVADASGNANGGSIAGASWSTAGKFGKALSFDGSGDMVTVADSASLDLTTGMTLEAWVRPSALSGWETVILKEQPGYLIYALYGNTDANRPSAHVFTTSEAIKDGTAALPTATWTHLAATYDGFDLRLYVDGTQVSSLPLSGAMTTSTSPLRIGGNSIWPEWFGGLIDEVRVYKRALTPTELAADAARPVVPGS